MLSQHHPHAMRASVVDERQPGLPRLHRRRYERAIELHAVDAAADAVRVLDRNLVACAPVLEHDLEARPAAGNARREGER